MSKEFRDIKVGQLFHYNGNHYVKQSTRTVKLLLNDRIFYFRQKEIVHPMAW